METHCYFLSAGTLRAIVGDDVDHGAGRTQYSGLWYLGSTATGGVTTVSKGYGNLLFGGHRGTSPEIRALTDDVIELSKPADESNGFIETRATYQLAEPHYVDYRLTATARDGCKAGPRYLSWCCYMNSPLDGGVHFLENGRWAYHFNPIHGNAAMLFPAGQPREEREPWGRGAFAEISTDRRGFDQSDSGHTFDHPFYFGIIHGLVYQIMADWHSAFRIFISPSGAGGSIVPGDPSPAWDFGWHVRALEPGESREINVRIAHFQPQTHAGDAAWAEYEAFAALHPCQDRV